PIFSGPILQLFYSSLAPQFYALECRRRLLNSNSSSNTGFDVHYWSPVDGFHRPDRQPIFGPMSAAGRQLSGIQLPMKTGGPQQAGKTMPLLLRFCATWIVLLLLWLALVFQFTKTELLIGSAASAVTTLLLLITLRAVPLCFQPRLRWLAQALRLPAVIARDTWILIKDFARRLLGARKRSGFEVVKFAVRGASPHACAQRALALLFVTMSPNSVVLDVDKERGDIFLHHLASKSAPVIVGKLEE
ncbi:MAG: Na+/H+ antiporter subunit E, partial [Terriglobales bacterium]